MRVFLESTVVFIISVDKSGKSKLPVVVNFLVPRELVVASETAESRDVAELWLTVVFPEEAET